MFLRRPFAIVFFLVYLSGTSAAAFGQKMNLGVIVGTSLTDDFRPATRTFLGGQTQQVTNASEWFMIGPTAEFELSRRWSVEVDAVRRRIRSTQLTVLSEPLELPNGVTIRSFGPYLADGFTWQFSVLGKYQLSAPKVKPFVEAGASFFPQENRDQTGVTAGSGVELSFWRLQVAPTLRYTRWLNNSILGATDNQFQFLVGVHERSDSARPQVFGRPFRLGFVAGFGLTKLLRDHVVPLFSYAQTSDAHTPIAGIMLELPILNRLSLEFDGLYRATHEVNGRILADGSIRYSGQDGAFLTWEFPVLGKFKTSPMKAAPIIEIGPSFRAIAHANSENHSHVGITGGIGFPVRLGQTNLTPAVRYTHWGVDKNSVEFEPADSTRPNQFELVIGFSF